jgi:hypothetical protein
VAQPTRVHVRMYQVGFGDCFLLSVDYDGALEDGRRARHVLIDFGSTHPPRTPITPLLPTTAELIEEHCGGQLDVIVVTHRHKDHIDGFGNAGAAKIIDGLRPRLVVRPWTEDPALPDDARGLTAGAAPNERFAASLGEAQAFAALAKAAVASDGRRPRGIAGDLAALADDQLPNQTAIDNLNRWAGEGAAEYLRAEDESKIPKFVPGIAVRVLGPPTAEQEPDVVKQRANDDQYWLMQQQLLEGGARPLAALAGEEASVKEAELAADAGPVRWLVQRMNRQHLASMLRLVHTLDSALNNTSVILLVDIGDKRLLFPGDAQIENWSYMLLHARRRRPVLELLKEVDLYKVGHHGSRNATPHSLFDTYWGTDPDPARPMVALMSTRAGVHGKSEATAVPRATLVAALKRRMTLYSTDEDFAPGREFLEVAAPARGADRFELVEEGG